MLLEEIRNIKSGRKELRTFGLTFAIILAAAGGIMIWKDNGLYLFAFGAALFFVILAIFRPSPLKPLQKAWMALAAVLGFVMSRLILILLFYLILTPVSLIPRLFGKRFLDLKPDPNLPSYWNERSGGASSSSNYTKQY
jgi:hypothetical protein